MAGVGRLEYGLHSYDKQLPSMLLKPKLCIKYKCKNNIFRLLCQLQWVYWGQCKYAYLYTDSRDNSLKLVCGSLDSLEALVQSKRVDFVGCCLNSVDTVSVGWSRHQIYFTILYSPIACQQSRENNITQHSVYSFTFAHRWP